LFQKINKMLKNRHLSLVVHSIYVVLTGIQLVFVPNFLLSNFGFEPTSEIWIKVMGIVVASLAFMYYAISQSEDQKIVSSTVWARLFVGAGFTILALSGAAKASIVLFAGIDIATAVWTWTELRKK
jgi:hypothetical protein